MSYDRDISELFASPSGEEAVSLDGTPVTGWETTEHDRRTPSFSRIGALTGEIPAPVFEILRTQEGVRWGVDDLNDELGVFVFGDSVVEFDFSAPR